MNTKRLEILLKEKGFDIRVLCCEAISGGYWIVYTTDMDYMPTVSPKKRRYLEEKEKDIIALDIEDAITQIVNKIAIQKKGEIHNGNSKVYPGIREEVLS